MLDIESYASLEVNIHIGSTEEVRESHHHISLAKTRLYGFCFNQRDGFEDPDCFMATKNCVNSNSIENKMKGHYVPLSESVHQGAPARKL